jgi:biotin carboxyl carrier protein
MKGLAVPTFSVSIQGKTYQVEIPDPGAMPLQVVVDGEAFEVGIIGTEISTEVLPVAEGPLPVAQPLPLPAPPRVNVARPAVPAGGDTGGNIIAPMPGTILSLAVSIGQHVDAGQVACVLEAMKMKNPIRATHAGTVIEIAVRAGQTVAYGDLLVRLG